MSRSKVMIALLIGGVFMFGGDAEAGKKRDKKAEKPPVIRSERWYKRHPNFPPPVNPAVPTAPIPEPSSIILALVGGAVVAGVIYKSR